MQRSRLLATVGALSLVIPTTIVHADETAEPSTLLDLVQAAPSHAVPEEASDQVSVNRGRVTVIVEVEGDPVAVVEAEQGDLNESAEEKHRETLKKRQEQIIPAIEALGGTVENTMQSAYNGMRVSIDADQLDALRGLSGVTGVHAVPTYERSNVAADVMTGVAAAWQGTGVGDGVTGKGIKVAILDTGIDYTHATFGGAGTREAFDAATKDQTLTDFGPRVKGGIDLVGDEYTGKNTPKADPNPIDCIQAGHGTHVAATAGGSGVTVDGKTYTGGYGQETLGTDFLVGPGSAPEADLYAVRVFGCDGTTDVVVEAIDWAVKNDMDVINMSLGSPFGRPEEPDSVAAANAVAAGVVVVASAGNSGPSPYLTGSPAAAPGVISVAANDARKVFPGLELTMEGDTVQAVAANGIQLTQAAPLHVLKDAQGQLGLGCTAEEYQNIPAGSIVVTRRGTCARVARAVLGQKAGASAVIMVNSTDELPPFEGPITQNPDTGEAYQVTIPFIGVAAKDAEILVKHDGHQATGTPREIPNPGYSNYANFTSSGPRSGDSALRPSLTAPGVSIVSAGVGAGTGPLVMSGTSMAAPHAAGIAALAVQGHPGWSAEEVSAALVSTADSSKVANYRTVRGGGLVDAPEAVSTSVFAYGDSTEVNGRTIRDAVLSFGYAEVSGTHTDTRKVTLVNKGDKEQTFAVTVDPSQDSLSGGKVTVSPTSVTVPAGGTAEVSVEVSISAADVPPGTPGKGRSPWFNNVSGNIRFAQDNGTNLAVPYLLVPRSLSEVTAGLVTTGVDAGQIQLTNANAAREGDAKLFTWSLSDAKDQDPAKDPGIDLASLGVQTIEDGGKRYLAFAVNMHSRFSNPASIRVEIPIDVDADGKADHILFSADQGRTLVGTSNGVAETFRYDASTKKTAQTGFLTVAPTDSSTMIMLVDLADLGSPSRVGFTASTYSGDLEDKVDGVASYEPGNRPFGDGLEVTVPASGSAKFDVAVNRVAAEDQKPLGWLAVVFDNAQGVSEALTGELPAGVTPPSPTPTPPAPSPTVAPTDPAPSPTVAPTDPAPSPTVAPTVMPSAPVKPTPPPVRPGLPRTGS